MSRRKKISYWSIISGLGLGFLIGGFLDGTIANIPQFVFFLIPMVFMGYLGYSKPVFVEYLSYAVAFVIIVNYAWDWRVGDRNSIRNYLFFTAIILTLINISTGRVKLIGAKKTAKRAIGL